ncbi:MAG TPA: FtsX-like permease family protein [Actinomycetes bacterium]|nr:FtsX-like permease family protein [Actinomycetes bacterium]
MRFFAADLRPGLAPVAAVLLAAPLLGVLGTLVALRQVTVTPFAVQRRARTPAPSWWRLLPLLAGCSLFLVGTALSRRIPEPLLAGLELGGLGLVLVGLPQAGPLLVRASARLVLRTGKLSGSSMVALRRLERDPSAGFRVVAGLVLAAFVFGFVSTLDLTAPAPGTLQGDVTIQLGGAPLQPSLARLDAIPGVRAVAPVAYGDSTSGIALLTTCAGLTDVLGARLTAGRCTDGGILVRAGAASAGRIGQPASVDVPAPGSGGLRPVPGKVTGRFDEVPERGVDVVLALPLRRLATQELAEAKLATDRTRTTELAVIKAVAETLPLASAGTADLVFATRPAAAALTRTLRLALFTAIVVAAVGLLVSIAEALLDRRIILALLSALGMGPGGARRLTAVEVGLPLLVGILPTLLLGVGLSYSAGKLLAGDVWFPWSELGFAVTVIAALAGVGFAAVLALLRATPTAQLLRSDS